MRVDAEPAFVLHSRPYRETSQLLDLFTLGYGRLRAVARGFRSGGKKGAVPLSPFKLLQLSFSGKGELKTLLSAENAGPSQLLTGNRLFTGFYLNELLLRVLAEQDPHQGLFERYRNMLELLASDKELEPGLRAFELTLLEEIGYGLVMDVDAETGSPVQADQWYWFDPEVGVVSRPKLDAAPTQPNWFYGMSLLAISQGHFGLSTQAESQGVRRDAKRLLRLAMQPHLGNKPLRSRELFVSARSGG